jgi:hypothetical protein
MQCVAQIWPQIVDTLHVITIGTILVLCEKGEEQMFLKDLPGI